jgi:hypothetical protein
MVKYKLPRHNLLNLKHGMKSPLIRQSYEMKYAARIRDLAGEDAEPQLIQWLAETFTTVDLGDKYVEAGGTLPPRMLSYYERAKRRIPKLCAKLGVPIHVLRPRSAAQPPAEASVPKGPPPGYRVDDPRRVPEPPPRASADPKPEPPPDPPQTRSLTGVWYPPPQPRPNPPMPPRLREVIQQEERERRGW